MRCFNRHWQYPLLKIIKLSREDSFHSEEVLLTKTKSDILYFYSNKLFHSYLDGFPRRGVANGLGKHWRAGEHGIIFCEHEHFDFLSSTSSEHFEKTLVECLLNIMVIQTRKRHFEKYICVRGIGFRKLPMMLEQNTNKISWGI